MGEAAGDILPANSSIRVVKQDFNQAQCEALLNQDQRIVSSVHEYNFFPRHLICLMGGDLIMHL